MLNFFLVLGQVPGTNFQLTFNELVAFSVLWASFLLYANRLYLRRRFWRTYYGYGDLLSALRHLLHIRPLVR